MIMQDGILVSDKSFHDSRQPRELFSDIVDKLAAAYEKEIKRLAAYYQAELECSHNVILARIARIEAKIKWMGNCNE